MTPTISTLLKNIANDSDINGIIPKAYNSLELVAAASARASEIARLEGKDEADRHDYLVAVPEYLAALPKSLEAALQIVKLDASAALSIPGIASDFERLTAAREQLNEAESAVAEAELLEGRRLSRIQTLETELAAENRQLQEWSINFDGEQKAAEDLILEHWGKTPVVAPFDTLATLAVLRRLAPQATAAIHTRIGIIDKELASLRASEPPKRKA